MTDGPAMEPTYSTPEQVAAMLQVSVRSVYRMVAKDPTMPALKLNGGALRFPRERLERWLRDREHGRAQPKRLAIVKAEAR